jgi:hypothetical protein
LKRDSYQDAAHQRQSHQAEDQESGIFEREHRRA